MVGRSKIHCLWLSCRENGSLGLYLLYFTQAVVIPLEGMTEREFQDQILSQTDRIYPMVLRMLSKRTDAEDAIQDIMLKLWERRKKIAQHPNMSGLVILTARNHCLDVLKKKRLPIEKNELRVVPVPAIDGNESMEWKELQQLILEILEKVPVNQREVLLLRDLDGYEYSEIAAALELKVEHVRVLLSRARKLVRMKLKKLHYHEGR